ncbi:MAG TPA: TerC/Alx family metal homeostasis membrane protein [Nitrososphaeraceae archaeon]
MNDNILWIIFSLFVSIALAVDLGLFTYLINRIRPRPNKPIHSTIVIANHSKTALKWTITWITMAGIFAVLIWSTMNYDKMLEFVTAYTLEKTLSVDNMFVFLLVFSSLSIPIQHQHRVLSVGILSAIAMRIFLILIGVSLLETFHFMIYILGGIVLFTALRMLFQKKEQKIDIEKNIAIRLLKKFIPLDLTAKTDKFLYKKNGVLYATPLLVVLIIIEMTDLIFAFDSIPAVLAITNDYFIVITSNVFAIFGLRSLYFLLAGMMEKFYYLKPALLVLLFFIGFKMLLSEWYKIPLDMSLAIISIILISAIGFSLRKIRKINKISK